MSESNPHNPPSNPSPPPSPTSTSNGAGVPPASFSPRNRRKRRPLLWIVVGLLLLLGGGGGLWAWHAHSVAAAAAIVDPANIVTVTRGDLEKSVDSSGKIVSNLDIDIKCRASGEVIRLPIDISQPVKKGDLLCQLDPTDEKLAVRSAEATVAQSTARLAQARVSLQIAELNLVTTRQKSEAALTSAKVKAANLQAKAERQKQLFAQQLGSAEELETAQTDAALARADELSAQAAIAELEQQSIQLENKRQDVKTAEAQLQADQIGLDVQRQQLIYTTVESPMDAVVSARNIQIGTIIASGTNAVNGGTAILTLSDLSHIFMMATVDESDIGDVHVGQKARISVDSYPHRVFTGQVVRIAVKGVNSSNVITFEVKIEVLDEHKDLLKLEMTGQATIVEETREKVLLIPAGTVIREADKTFVKTVGGEKKPVTLGLDAADNVEVLSGLSESDKILLNTVDLPSKWKSKRGPP